MKKPNDTAVQYINTLNIELDSLESLIANLRKSESFYELVVIPRGEDYHVPPTSYILQNHKEISNSMHQLRENKLDIMPGERETTCFIENDYATESTAIELELKIVKKISNVTSWEKFKVERNMKVILNNLFALMKVVSKAKQLALNLCNLLSYQKVLFTSAALNKHLHTISDKKRLVLPFYISNFGSVLLDKIVKAYIVFVNNELLIEIVVPFTDPDLWLSYEMQPFPAFQSNFEDKRLAAYIKPRSDFIAVSDSTDRYLFLNKSDLEKCEERNTFFLCENEFLFETTFSCEKMLLTNPNYGDYPFCNIEYSQGKEYYFQKMNNKRLWLASTISKFKLVVFCSGGLHRLPITGNQIIELPKSCRMRIGEKEVYGSDGAYVEGDIIIPKVKLNLHKEFIYKTRGEEPPKSKYATDSTVMSNKDWVYLIFYGSITFVIIIFLGTFTFVLYLFLGNKKGTATEREDSYVPTHAVNHELNCNFLGASDYEKPRWPPLPVKYNEPGTSVCTV